MKRTFFVPLLVLTAVLTACAADCLEKPDQRALAGGYSSVEIDPDVRKVADFAVRARSENAGKPLRLVKILKAERQVVAGLNFRLAIEIADGDKSFVAHAVVWKKLDGSMVLTSWNIP